jgi:hypothetical protein
MHQPPYRPGTPPPPGPPPGPAAPPAPAGAPYGTGPRGPRRRRGLSPPMMILIVASGVLPILLLLLGPVVDDAVNEGTFAEPPEACGLASADVGTVLTDAMHGEGGKGGGDGENAVCEWRGTARLAGIPAGTPGDFSRLRVDLVTYRGDFVGSAEEAAKEKLVEQAKPSAYSGFDGKQESIPSPADEMMLVSNVTTTENDKPVYTSVLWVRVDNLIAEIEFRPEIEKPSFVLSRDHAEQLLSRRGVLTVGARVTPKLVTMAKREQQK